MKTFKEFIIDEKASILTNDAWYILKLDDGTEISTSTKLMANKEIQVSKSDERLAKNIKIKDCLLSTLKEVGIEVDVKDKKVAIFIKQVSDNCKCDLK